MSAKSLVEVKILSGNQKKIETILVEQDSLPVFKEKLDLKMFTCRQANADGTVSSENIYVPKPFLQNQEQPKKSHNGEVVDIKILSIVDGKPIIDTIQMDISSLETFKQTLYLFETKWLVETGEDINPEKVLVTKDLFNQINNMGSFPHLKQ